MQLGAVREAGVDTGRKGYYYSRPCRVHIDSMGNTFVFARQKVIVSNREDVSQDALAVVTGETLHLHRWVRLLLL